MKTRMYSVTGSKKNGCRVAVPTASGIVPGCVLECEIKNNGDTLVYKVVKVE